jgi:DNA polymerase-3 subunit epsilon
VYIFYGEQGEPLYIGKSKQIRSRVQAHFYSDLRSDTELLIKNLVYSIEARTTAGELSALLLESELIKTLRPLFNRSLRRHEPAIEMLLTFNANNYYHIKSESKHIFDPEKGDMRLVFKTKKIAQRTLTKVADEHQLCYKLLGIESGSGACMRFHLGECRGACIGKELAARYNLRVIEALRNVAIKPWPYSGPVVFKEYNVVTGQEAAHCINQWIYLGDAQHEDEAAHSLPQHQDFDLDAYVILKRFLLNSPDKVKLYDPQTQGEMNKNFDEFEVKTIL